MATRVEMAPNGGVDSGDSGPSMLRFGGEVLVACSFVLAIVIFVGIVGINLVQGSDLNYEMLAWLTVMFMVLISAGQTCIIVSRWGQDASPDNF